MNKQLIEVIATGIWNGEKFHTENRGVYKSMSDEQKVLAHRRAEKALKAINEAGFVVVPKEPTEAMKHIGHVCLIDNCISTEIYKAMIGAAQCESSHVEKTCATCKHEQHVHCNSATDCVNNSLWEGE